MSENILILGPNEAYFRRSFPGEQFTAVNGRISASFLREFNPKLVISYGYRYILDPLSLREVQGRAFNLHISLLPWNRGADPNLWSWLQNTPRGVTIHHLTPEIDQGPIAFQRAIDLDANASLASTYETLQKGIRSLLIENWPLIKSLEVPAVPQKGIGTKHKSSDKDLHLEALEDGWQTRCSSLLEYGRRHGLWVRSS